MSQSIYLRDLPCYKEASEEKQKKIPGLLDHYVYDFSNLPTDGLKKELSDFIKYRGEHCKLSSMCSEYSTFKLFCRFIYEREKELHSYLERSEAEWENRLKAWLLSNGYAITSNHYMNVNGKTKIGQPMAVSFLKKLLCFLEPEDSRDEREKDIWQLDKLPIAVKQNPIKPVRRINFTKILQPQIREEVKQCCYLQLRYLAIGSINAELTAMRRFSAFLAEEFPDVLSLANLKRIHIEEYLIYINTDVSDKQFFHSELSYLKTVIDEVGRIIEQTSLSNLFLPGDIPKSRKILFRAYSDAELKRLNSHIVKMDEQIARALIIHQMLGTRISDSLSLPMEGCLYEEDGQYMIRVEQVKNGFFSKTICEETAALIQKSIDYTKERYGDVHYIFVNEGDLSRPISYGMIRERVLIMIRELDLRDDYGELFNFESHMFRHSYGQRLTEMHLEDETIAQMLGQRGLQTVHCYRRMGDKVLADETREMRSIMDDILSEMIKEWDGYEEI